MLDKILMVFSALGFSTLLNYFVQRYFSKKDEAERKSLKKKELEREEREQRREELEQRRQQDLDNLKEQVGLGLETIRLLSYSRVASEAERLIDKGFATFTERTYLRNLYDNYKKWGWNGDMEERMKTVYDLPHSPDND